MHSLHFTTKKSVGQCARESNFYDLGEFQVVLLATADGVDPVPGERAEFE